MKAFPNENEYPNGEPDYNGMDLRDYFAAKAMQAEMMLDESRPYHEVAECAYEMADTMMRKRNDES